MSIELWPINIGCLKEIVNRGAPGELIMLGAELYKQPVRCSSTFSG